MTQNVLKDLFAETLREMLEAEPYTPLGYEKNTYRERKRQTAITVDVSADIKQLVE